MHSSSEQELKHPQKRLLNRDQELQPHPSFLPRFSCSPGMPQCFCHLSLPGPGPALLTSFWNSLKKTDSSHLMVSWTNFCSQEETSHCRTLKYWHSGMRTLPQIHSYQRPPGVEPQLPALNNDRAGPSPDPAGRGSQAQGELLVTPVRFPPLWEIPNFGRELACFDPSQNTTFCG